MIRSNFRLGNVQFLLISCLLSFQLFAQFPGCPAVDAGPDVNTDCTTPCVDLTATPFDAGATTDYTAGSIPYNPPVTFGQAGGTSVSVGVDDIWSGVINLPFNFCFYGQTYTQCVIGSNGAISFNTGYANGGHPWSFTASCPSGALVSAGDIFGPYHDIDPSVGGSVQWYLLGTAPCRIFVVTFNSIPMFSCNNLSSSHMIVLYETTNAIDVYVEYRQVCGSWNSGNAVIGIQNPAGTAGVAAPGRNTGSWAVNTPEGWRFLPSGAPIYTLEWFDDTGASLGSSNTISVCPAMPTTYTAQATYTSCDGSVIIETDDVIVNPQNGGLSLTEISNSPTDCGIDNGSVEVTASGGGGSYNYSLNDTLNWQGSGVFDGLGAGTYTIYTQDANGCIGAINVTISNLVGPSLSVLDSANTTCGNVNGSFEVEAINGSMPYSYTIDGGATSQSTGIFNNLIDTTYTVIVTDANNCMDSVVITIGADPYPTLTLVSTDTICNSANDGEVHVMVTGGVPPYDFYIDSEPTQTSPIFTGVDVGNHVVTVVDSNGCESTVNAEVFAWPAPIVQNDTTTCDYGLILDAPQTVFGGYWSTSDTTLHFNPDSSAWSPWISVPNEGGTYTLTFTDTVCYESDAFVLTLPPHVWAIGTDTNICVGSEWLITVLTEPTVTGYLWSNGETTSAISVTDPGDYIVIVNNECFTGTDTVTIGHKICDINVPNVVSLSSEVGNNFWFVTGDGMVEYNCVITNRWGNVVFQTNDILEKWDVHSNGKLVAEGVYFYRIDAVTEGGDEITKHGFLHVLY